MSDRPAFKLIGYVPMKDGSTAAVGTGTCPRCGRRVGIIMWGPIRAYFDAVFHAGATELVGDDHLCQEN